VQYQGVITKKKAYFAKFLQPIFVFLPVNVTGQLAKLASLNFRLFGNILAGAIIWGLMYQILVRIHWLFCIAGLIILPLALIFEKFAPDRGLGKAKQAVRLLIRFIQLIPAVLIVFGVIEGILQAFVIALLTSMYISGEVDTTTSH
jgi:F0F1-type ATP synthase membrane subunit a